MFFLEILNRSRIFSLFLVVCIFCGCSSQKNNDSIAFVRLQTNVLYDTAGNPYLYIKQYAEYKFNNKDSLFIGVSENHSNYSENNFRIDNDKPFHFGLEKFCATKINHDFSELMTKILNGEYEKSYKKPLGEGAAIDDREIVVFVINQNGKQRFIVYYENYLLPKELKMADSLIRAQINLSKQMLDKPNYSPQLILRLQDSLFREYPPPEPPLNSTIKFIPPMID